MNLNVALYGLKETVVVKGIHVDNNGEVKKYTR